MMECPASLEPKEVIKCVVKIFDDMGFTVEEHPNSILRAWDVTNPAIKQSPSYGVVCLAKGASPKPAAVELQRANLVTAYIIQEGVTAETLEPGIKLLTYSDFEKVYLGPWFRATFNRRIQEALRPLEGFIAQGKGRIFPFLRKAAFGQRFSWPPTDNQPPFPKVKFIREALQKSEPWKMDWPNPKEGYGPLFRFLLGEIQALYERCALPEPEPGGPKLKHRRRKGAGWKPPRDCPPAVLDAIESVRLLGMGNHSRSISFQFVKRSVSSLLADCLRPSRGRQDELLAEDAPLGEYVTQVHLLDRLGLFHRPDVELLLLLPEWSEGELDDAKRDQLSQARKHQFPHNQAIQAVAKILYPEADEAVLVFVEAMLLLQSTAGRLTRPTRELNRMWPQLLCDK